MFVNTDKKKHKKYDMIRIIQHIAQTQKYTQILHFSVHLTTIMSASEQADSVHYLIQLFVQK